MKLKFIINPSLAYLRYYRDSTLEEWFGTTQHKEIHSLSEVGASTLFGAAPPSVLIVTNNTAANSLAKTLSTFDKHKLSSGVILLFEGAPKSVGKLMQEVEKIGGEVDSYDTKNKKWQEGLAKQELSSLQLSHQVSSFLLDWAGADYEQLLPLVKSLKNLSSDQQRKVTLEAILARLPMPPGSVPPWEIEQPLLAGRVVETVSIFRKIVTNSSPIVVISVLLKKFEQMYRVAALQSADPSINKTVLASTVGVSSGQLFYIQKSSTIIGAEKLEKLVVLFDDLYGKLTTGAAFPSARCEVALTKAIAVINQ